MTDGSIIHFHQAFCAGGLTLKRFISSNVNALFITISQSEKGNNATTLRIDAKLQGGHHLGGKGHTSAQR